MEQMAFGSGGNSGPAFVFGLGLGQGIVQNRRPNADGRRRPDGFSGSLQD